MQPDSTLVLLADVKWRLQFMLMDALASLGLKVTVGSENEESDGIGFGSPNQLL